MEYLRRYCNLAGLHPWAYALSFPHFSRLHHFVWNINHPGGSYTPQCLLVFEQENPISFDEDEDLTTDEDAPMSDEDESISDEDLPVSDQDGLVWHEDYQSELELIAKALYRRCPSLEYMVLRPHIEDEAYTYRRRDYNGEIYFEHSEVDSRLMWERNPPKAWDYYKDISKYRLL